MNHGDRGQYFPSQKTFCNATTCFFAKRRLKDERRNSIWLMLLGNLLQPIRSTTRDLGSDSHVQWLILWELRKPVSILFLIWTLAKVDSAGISTIFHSLNEALRCSIAFFELTVTKFGFIGRSLLQWRIQGIQPPPLPPRLIFRPNEKEKFETGPPPLYLRVWIAPTPSASLKVCIRQCLWPNS